MRYLGDSYRWKTKKRMMKRTIMSPPRVQRRYRQPMFFSLVHPTAEAQEKFAMSGHAT